MDNNNIDIENDNILMPDMSNIAFDKNKKEGIEYNEDGTPKGGRGKIGNYINGLSEEDKLAHLRKAQAAQARNRKNTGNIMKIMNQLFKSGITDDEDVKKILEDKGVEQSEAAAMLFKQMRTGWTNPKSAAFAVKVAGQMPTDKMVVAAAEMPQMEKDELLSKFGFFDTDTDSDGEDNEDD